MQTLFFGAAKQLIVELEPTADGYHVLVDLEEEKVVKPNSEAKKDSLEEGF